MPIYEVGVVAVLLAFAMVLEDMKRVGVEAVVEAMPHMQMVEKEVAVMVAMLAMVAMLVMNRMVVEGVGLVTAVMDIPLVRVELPI